jgi:putative sterol carrier protein
MDMSAITEALRAKVGESASLGASLKFDCGADGVVIIDGRADPSRVDNHHRDTDCSILISRDNLAALMKGELDPVAGFMTGKLKIEGDMSVALKLQRIV